MWLFAYIVIGFLIFRAFKNAGRYAELESRLSALETRMKHLAPQDIAPAPSPAKKEEADNPYVFDYAAIARAAGISPELPKAAVLQTAPEPFVAVTPKDTAGEVKEPPLSDMREEAFVPPVVSEPVKEEEPEVQEEPEKVEVYYAGYDPAMLPLRDESEEVAELVEAEAEPEPVIEPKDSVLSSLEQRIGSRWLVWLGGLSLIVGGAFFVGYSIDQGWLTIGLRMVMSGLFGIGLMALAGKIRRMPRYQEKSGKIVSLPQTISAAGAGILFASIYASYIMHHLISQPVAAIGLVAVSILTFFTSLRQGVIMAVIGLTGAYAVPALIMGLQASPLTLAYLFAITILAEVVDRRRNWAPLHWVSLGANMLWGLCLAPAMGADTALWAAGYFVTVSAIYSGRIATHYTSLALMLGVFLFRLVMVAAMGSNVLLLLIAGFAVPMIAGGRLRLARGSLIAAGFALAAAVAIPLLAQGPADYYLPLFLVFAAALLGDVLRRIDQDDELSQLVAFSPLALVAVQWGLAAHFERSNIWTLLFLATAALLGGAYAWMEKQGRREAVVAAILLMQTAAAPVMAAVAYFAQAELVLVLTLYVPMLAWLCRRNKRLGNFLAVYMAGVIGYMLIESDLLTRPLQEGGLLWILQGMVVPLAAYLLTSWLIRRETAFELPARIAQCAGTIYAIILPYALVRWLGGAETLFASTLDFREACLLGSIWLVVAGGLIHTSMLRESFVAKYAGLGMIVMATLAYGFGPLLSLNPLFTLQPVSSLEMLLAYGASTLLYIYGVKLMGRAGQPWFAKASGVMALAMGMMLTVLECYSLMRGGNLHGTISLPESTLIGLIWMTLALGLGRVKSLASHEVGGWMIQALAISGSITVALFNLLILNPFWGASHVGMMPVFNWLIPAYALPVAALALLARQNYLRDKDAGNQITVVYALLAIISAMIFTTLEVRHLMHDGSFKGLFDFKETALIGLSWLGMAIALDYRYGVSGGGLPRMASAVMGVGGVILMGAVNLIFLNPLWVEADAGSWPIINWLIPAYGLPFVALTLLARREWLTKHEENSMRVWAYVTGALLFAMSFVAQEVFHLMRNGQFTGVFNFKESALIGFAYLALAGGLYKKWWAKGGDYVRRPVTILTFISALLLVVFNLFFLNPLWRNVTTGELPLANWLFVAYCLPALLLCWILQKRELLQSENEKTLSMMMVIVYLLSWGSLEVRHFFHGPLLAGAITQAEWYSYSAIWLLSGFALLAFGVWKVSRLLRQVALGLIIVTVAKVFLSDMNDLTGLWRAASFMGLGLALIGVGYLYQRFVVNAQDKKA